MVVVVTNDHGVRSSCENHLLVSLNVEQLAIVRAQEFVPLLSRYRRVAQESEEEEEDDDYEEEVDENDYDDVDDNVAIDKDEPVSGVKDLVICEPDEQ